MVVTPGPNYRGSLALFTTCILGAGLEEDNLSFSEWDQEAWINFSQQRGGCCLQLKRGETTAGSPRTCLLSLYKLKAICRTLSCIPSDVSLGQYMGRGHQSPWLTVPYVPGPTMTFDLLSIMA